MSPWAWGSSGVEQDVPGMGFPARPSHPGMAGRMEKGSGRKEHLESCSCHPVPAGIRGVVGGHLPEQSQSCAWLWGSPGSGGAAWGSCAGGGSPWKGEGAGSNAPVLQDVGFVLFRGRARLVPWYFPY